MHCIGSNLATLKIKLVVATMARSIGFSCSTGIWDTMNGAR